MTTQEYIDWLKAEIASLRVQIAALKQDKAIALDAVRELCEQEGWHPDDELDAARKRLARQAAAI